LIEEAQGSFFGLERLAQRSMMPQKIPEVNRK
jgi:hypothetical protein